MVNWLRGLDLNQRPLGYEPNELPGCSTPLFHPTGAEARGQTQLCKFVQRSGLDESQAQECGDIYRAGALGAAGAPDDVCAGFDGGR